MTDTDDYRRPPIMRPRRVEPEQLPPFSEMVKAWDFRSFGARNSLKVSQLKEVFKGVEFTSSDIQERFGVSRNVARHVGNELINEGSARVVTPSIGSDPQILALIEEEGNPA